MRIVITGASGQLGQSLIRLLPDQSIFGISSSDYDLGDPAITSIIAGFAPDLVIHAAAMTDVDGCERSPELAYRINSLGTQHVAQACQLTGAPMVYVSTDYVFDGMKQAPYWEYDAPNPLSVYGASKLAGERWVEFLLDRYYIARTAWLYSHHGPNFVSRILQLAEERPELTVVTNEVGCPTLADDLAEAILKLIRHPVYGIFHLVSEGYCSRYEFVRAILDRAGKRDYPVHPATEYPRRARPPAFAPLRNFRAATQFGIRLPTWQEALDAWFAQ